MLRPAHRVPGSTLVSWCLIGLLLWCLLLLPIEMQAYDGLGPEVINSRLAMLGFAVAAFWELTQGIDIFQQVDKYPLITIATFVTFTVASWIPFMQGQSYNVKSGPFTPAVSISRWKPVSKYIWQVSLLLNLHSGRVCASLRTVRRTSDVYVAHAVQIGNVVPA
jgi:hypothetical protein